MPTDINVAVDDTAVDTLAADGLVVVDGWLGRASALALRCELLSLLDLGCFAPARVGAGTRRQEASGVRRNSICWFDAEAPPQASDGRLGILPGREVVLFLARIALLRARLNRTCFLSLTEVECHAACYEPGAFYAAHLDNPAGDSRRVISFSHYLSDRGSGESGGCLRVHGGGKDPIDIEPLFDRLVVFQSRRVLHEVMPVAVRRFSMTGWMSGETNQSDWHVPRP
jgi:SM-20-related protein